MPSSGHGKTSAIFYYRGVPKNFTDFGILASANYSIFQPTRPLLGTPFFSKSISNFIAVYR
jgi:hypothetical protein